MCFCLLTPMQFIDGRLDLLNSGEGFSDVFEEEINMGEYAGKKYFKVISDTFVGLPFVGYHDVIGHCC